MRPHDDYEQMERIARLVEQGLNEGMGRRELIRRGLALGLSLSGISLALAACGVERPPAAPADSVSRWRPPTPTAAPAAPSPPPLSGQASPVATPAPAALRFAVIGDYGMEGEPAAAVSGLVASWAPEFLITTGDNNYPDGAAETIDRNIGQYYSAFIAPYKGAFGQGAAENRFFPVLGNHDWVVGYPEPYLAYFSLPGNGRYYSLERGPVGLFALDSMPGEPDGWTLDSPQAGWLQAALAASSAPWKIVVMHHPPFSSGHHGSSDWMQWPFAAWGARLVLAGHDHSYERIRRDGITYVVNGLGGAARYAAGWGPVEGSQIFFNADHGAMLIEADATQVQARFIARDERVIDEFRLPE